MIRQCRWNAFQLGDGILHHHLVIRDLDLVLSLSLFFLLATQEIPRGKEHESQQSQHDRRDREISDGGEIDSKMPIKPDPLSGVLGIADDCLGKRILHRPNREGSRKFLFQIQPIIQRHRRGLSRRAAHESHDDGDKPHQPQSNPKRHRRDAKVKQALHNDQQERSASQRKGRGGQPLDQDRERQAELNG